MKTQDFENWLDREARALPESIEPERDLWPGIEARLDEPATVVNLRGGSRVWPFLSGIAATVLVALAVTQLQQRPVQTQTEAPPVILVEQYPATWVPEISRTRNQLNQGFENGLDRLPPDTRRIVEENLAQIHQSLAQIHEALAADPSNLALHRMLASTYQQELSLISNIQALSNSESESQL